MARWRRWAAHRRNCIITKANDDRRRRGKETACPGAILPVGILAPRDAFCSAALLAQKNPQSACATPIINLRQFPNQSVEASGPTRAMINCIFADLSADCFGPLRKNCEAFILAKLFAGIAHQTSPTTQHEHVLSCKERRHCASAHGAVEGVKNLLLVGHQRFDVIQGCAMLITVPSRPARFCGAAYWRPGSPAPASLTLFPLQPQQQSSCHVRSVVI